MPPCLGFLHGWTCGRSNLNWRRHDDLHCGQWPDSTGVAVRPAYRASAGLCWNWRLAGVCDNHEEPRPQSSS